MGANYCTVEDIKFTLPDVVWPTDRDAVLSNLCADASRAIDIFTRREPGAFAVEAAVARYFDGTGENYLWIPGGLADAPTLVEMSPDPTLATYITVASTDYIMWPYDAPSRSQPYARLDINSYGSGLWSAWMGWRRAVRITAMFGFSKEPSAIIKRATITQACRWYMRGQQSFQDVGAKVEVGQKVYKGVDLDISLLLDDLVLKVV
jgi:hypothetical protein